MQDKQFQTQKVINYLQYTNNEDIGVSNLCTPTPRLFPLCDTTIAHEDRIGISCTGTLVMPVDAAQIIGDADGHAVRIQGTFSKIVLIELVLVIRSHK